MKSANMPPSRSWLTPVLRPSRQRALQRKLIVLEAALPKLQRAFEIAESSQKAKQFDLWQRVARDVEIICALLAPSSTEM